MERLSSRLNIAGHLDCGRGADRPRRVPNLPPIHAGTCQLSRQGCPLGGEISWVAARADGAGERLRSRPFREVDDLAVDVRVGEVEGEDAPDDPRRALERG